MFDPDVFSRYLKVMALVEGGTGGEQANARVFKAKMEAQQPWLADAYRWHKHAEKNAQSPPPPPAAAAPPPHDASSGRRSPHGSAPFASGTNDDAMNDPRWRTLLDGLRNAYGTAREFVSAMRSAMRSVQHADSIVIKEKHQRSGAVTVTLTFAPDDLDAMDAYSAENAVHFRDRLLSRMEQTLNDMLGLVEMDPDEPHEGDGGDDDDDDDDDE